MVWSDEWNSLSLSSCISVLATDDNGSLDRLSCPRILLSDIGGKRLGAKKSESTMARFS